MANAGFLCQPIKSPPLFCQQLIDSNFHHHLCALVVVQALPHAEHIVHVAHRARLTYIPAGRRVKGNRVRLLPSQLLWNYPDYLKSQLTIGSVPV